MQNFSYFEMLCTLNAQKKHQRVLNQMNKLFQISNSRSQIPDSRRMNSPSFALESGIWILTADFWKNLFTFCHRNSRSELRRTPKSTIMKFSVLSVPRSCASLLLFQSAQFFQKRYSYVVTSVNKKSQKSNPRSQIPDSRGQMNCSVFF